MTFHLLRPRNLDELSAEAANTPTVKGRAINKRSRELTRTEIAQLPSGRKSNLTKNVVVELAEKCER